MARTELRDNRGRLVALLFLSATEMMLLAGPSRESAVYGKLDVETQSKRQSLSIFIVIGPMLRRRVWSSRKQTGNKSQTAGPKADYCSVHLVVVACQ